MSLNAWNAATQMDVPNLPPPNDTPMDGCETSEGGISADSCHDISDDDYSIEDDAESSEDGISYEVEGGIPCSKSFSSDVLRSFHERCDNTSIVRSSRREVHVASLRQSALNPNSLFTS